jgi:Protein of unknown function (DUF998)
MSLQTEHLRAQSGQIARLLACGVVAGLLFIATWLIQALTREGFDPIYHPLSLLSLGNLGWIQIANFVVTGALLVACATGMWRLLRPGACRNRPAPSPIGGPPRLVNLCACVY